MDTDEMIIALAQEQGLGVLTELELEFIKSQMTYDWYAVEPQMPYDVIQDRAMSYKNLKVAATPERFKQMYAFYHRNWVDPSE